MDSADLKAGALTRHKATGSVDAKDVTSLVDKTAANAAFGHMVASVPETTTMDIYNAFACSKMGKDVGPYMMPILIIYFVD